MTKLTLAARSNLRNALLCSLLTLGLAACGAEDAASSATETANASGADTTPSLVAPNVGLIDRSQHGSGTASTPGSGSSNSAPPSSTPVSGTVAANPPPSAPPANTSGNATLDWTPPTENSDGSVLTNLAGYTVYYGTSPGSLTQSVKVTNPGLATYTMTNLPAGTWYFAVTSYSSTGVESARSGVVSTTI